MTDAGYERADEYPKVPFRRVLEGETALPLRPRQGVYSPAFCAHPTERVVANRVTSEGRVTLLPHADRDGCLTKNEPSNRSTSACVYRQRRVTKRPLGCGNND